MTASAQRAAEPSMEEFLASIRRIIADDQSRARLGSAKLVSVPAGATEAPEGMAPQPDEPSALGALAPEMPSSAEPALARAAWTTGTARAGRRLRRRRMLLPRSWRPPRAWRSTRPKPRHPKRQPAMPSLSSGARSRRPNPPSPLNRCVDPRCQPSSPSSGPPREDGLGAAARLEAEVARLVQGELRRREIAGAGCRRAGRACAAGSLRRSGASAGPRRGRHRGVASRDPRGRGNAIRSRARPRGREPATPAQGGGRYLAWFCSPGPAGGGPGRRARRHARRRVAAGGHPAARPRGRCDPVERDRPRRGARLQHPEPDRPHRQCPHPRGSRHRDAPPFAESLARR